MLVLVGVWVLVAADGVRGRTAGLTAVLLVASALPLSGGRVGLAWLGLPGARTAEASTPGEFWFFHTDHLGSVQVLTDWPASPSTPVQAVDQVRYRAYGAVRCAGGNCGASAEPVSSRTFTGHERDGEAGLLYMGARYYDPEIGGFLTFDPASQYSSPYVYGGHNPLRGTDPTGAVFDPVTIAITMAALSAAASFVDALVQTGDLGSALQAGVMSAAMAAIAAPQGLIVNAIWESSKALGQGVMTVSLGYQAYGAAESFRNGNIASGVVSVASLALGSYDLQQRSAEPPSLPSPKNANRTEPTFGQRLSVASKYYSVPDPVEGLAYAQLAPEALDSALEWNAFWSDYRNARDLTPIRQ